LHVLGTEPLDHPHAGDRLLDHGRQLCRLALDAHDVGEQAAREPGGQDVEEGQGPEREDGEDRVDGGEDDGDGQDGHRVRDGERDQHHEQLHLLQVGVGSAHELAGLGLVVEREVQALQVGEQAIAQRRLDPAGLPEREVATQPGEAGRGHRHDAEQDGPAPQGGRVVRLDAAVDGVAHDDPGAHLGRGPRQPG
jgi:hypothetical protein